MEKEFKSEVYNQYDYTLSLLICCNNFNRYKLVCHVFERFIFFTVGHLNLFFAQRAGNLKS